MEPSTHRGGLPLDRSVSRVAYGEDARHVRLHITREGAPDATSSRTTIAGEVLVGDNVALLVALDLLGQPACVGLSSDEDEQGGRRDGIRGRGGGVLENEVLEPSLPTTVDNLSVKADLPIFS
jgi:hypothetical protein